MAAKIVSVTHLILSATEMEDSARLTTPLPLRVVKFFTKYRFWIRNTSFFLSPTLLTGISWRVLQALHPLDFNIRSIALCREHAGLCLFAAGKPHAW
ncbi:MAG TPA: hypothetical protein VFT65_11330, partial [Candidatus Angelobacter sp.]|nr:hypothetical protein [Candidatus Angelobacter sp.]